ncbi:MAG: hypothetical protein QXD03_03135 [Candidatus Anstonellales archaeon]
MILYSDKEISFLNAINNSFKEDMISDQIINLNNIGHDLVNMYGLDNLRSDFISHMLEYMHNNYLSVPNYDTIIMNQVEGYNSFYINYRFYIVDFPRDMIIQLFILTGCKTIVDCDIEKIKESMKEILINRIDSIRRMNIDKFDKTIIFYTYYLDMIDCDISNFYENYLRRLELIM